jgi:hypothetical protein
MRAEWIKTNQALDSASTKFIVNSAERLNSRRASVNVTVVRPDGSSFERQTYFIWESRKWLHALSNEEHTMFDGAL